MEQTKIEVSKPILSPTRSLDEGLETDPDRISTDSEHTTQTPTFDLLHRTDRDGVQHTTITRRNVETSPISSIICIDGGESDQSDNNDIPIITTTLSSSSSTTLNASSQVSTVTPNTKLDQQTSQQIQKNSISNEQQQQQQQQQQQIQKNHHHQQQQQQQNRRMKSKAPLPPNSNNSNSSLSKIYQPRSQSVDRIRSTINDFQRSSSNQQQQNILAGKFVRVTVDPKQQYLNYFKNYKSFHQSYHGGGGGGSSSPRLISSGSTSNLYKSYHSSLVNSQSSSLIDSPSSQPSGLLSLSNLSNMKSMPQYQSGGGGFSTIKSTKAHHQNNLSSHHHSSQPQSHLVCWTQSMDPRRARK
jgi:hypothetical protein